EEQQMHEVDVLERTEQVETEPARAIDDWIGAPAERWVIERERRGRLRAKIGDEGMKRDYHHDGEAAQVTQRQAGSGHETTQRPSRSNRAIDRALEVLRHSPIVAIML